jgi:nitrate reductase (NAD(P)H)
MSSWLFVSIPSPIADITVLTIIDSETAKAMMQDYHIGTLDSAAIKALASGEAAGPETSATREIFLQAKSWTKALLSNKKIISSDTRIFTFTLDHADQAIGLPTGQHLMLRLRDPVTREAIIRSYTPLSDCDQRGTLDILIKVYFDSPEKKGGKMTMALEAIPVGHFVEFKGPIGKFTYLGRGVCQIGSAQRTVKRFVMICGGSGVTPIWQVLRAVMADAADETTCVVLDGNREESDILCKEEMDLLESTNTQRCKILHTLSKPSDVWQGLKGRVGRQLLEQEIGKSVASDTMVLICGPEALEKAVHKELCDMGWKDDDILFF